MSLDTPHLPSGRRFETTHWSLVVQAADRDDSQAQQALSILCERYWLPLYACVRCRVSDIHEAQDLTQAFFTRLLEKNTFAQASPERGRFRAFLLTSLKNFLTNEWDRQQAQKRGGGQQVLSLDWDSGESRLSLEPADHQTPDRVFERQWTLTLLEHTVTRLQAEFAASGKQRQFELLKGTLTGDRGEASYADAAQELDMTADAVRQAAQRMRRRYRELLREEVAQTVQNPDEIDQEIQRLLLTLS